MKFSQEFNEMQENTVKPSWILNAGNDIISWTRAVTTEAEKL